jgi:hypothetical protein
MVCTRSSSPRVASGPCTGGPCTGSRRQIRAPAMPAHLTGGSSCGRKRTVPSGGQSHEVVIGTDQNIKGCRLRS